MGREAGRGAMPVFPPSPNLSPKGEKRKRSAAIMFLSPFGERLGEGVAMVQRAGLRPLSPPLPLAGARSMRCESMPFDPSGKARAGTRDTGHLPSSAGEEMSQSESVALRDGGGS
jgi:hypothetical protein